MDMDKSKQQMPPIDKEAQELIKEIQSLTSMDYSPTRATLLKSKIKILKKKHNMRMMGVSFANQRS